MTIDNYFYGMESIKDFDFVLRVLNSSKTNNQLDTSKRLFENFKNKWIFKIDSIDMMEYIYKFNSAQEKIVKDHNLF